ncbi:LacI family DNA-binding transcriptional regulator [Ginsengibacter hankyongi]|uniref:LacI family DNA-binding transcriptional regulator n=1 Tax=Ginsengibacter hankyongi TaxID=2607284 RepID=A0A5J5IJ88_9BACT|nr:substrate-binding domain-containing protein [Ginsengibacter hankyongi]KAA9040558.1 LacI family DNA-binding transcriptional regulator [Ginsengibacter hankyongi]
MPRVVCPRCEKAETVQKSGIVRKKQRFYCKDCNYHFTIYHESIKSRKKQKPNSGGQTSLLDIAKAVGVSVSTVSRALNNHPDISEKTKVAIKSIAKELAYEPNALAQSLVTRSTHTLGVIIPNLHTTFFATMLSGIQHVSSQAGYRVVICQSDDLHQTEVANVQALMNNMIDGLLFCHSLETSTFDHIKIQLRRGIPIVQFYRVSLEVETPCVFCEDENGAIQVTEHLIEMGCRRIGILLGPPHLMISKKRLEGYYKALNKFKIPLDPKLVANVDFSTKSVHSSVDNWLHLDVPVDAVFSISDKSAVQTIQYLKKLHIKVPDTVCVAGFGNEYTGEIIEPQLTTFDVRTGLIGEKTAKLLLNRIIDQNSTSENVTVKGHLIVRDSSKRVQHL